MSIRTKEYCDMCEIENGEWSEKARIHKEPNCPAYPQLIWTFFKKGFQIMKQVPNGKPVLQEGFLGNPNRLEFCDYHGDKFNSLLKAFARKDTRLATVLDDIHREDQELWDAKQKAKKAEFKKLTTIKEAKDGSRDRKHSGSSDKD